MFLSHLISFGTKQSHYKFREFPSYTSSCPILHSLPGIICNTNTIFENILDISHSVTLKKGDIVYPDIEKAPIIYLKKGKLCIYNINQEGKIFTPHFIFHGSLIYEAFFLTEGQFNIMPIKALEDSTIFVFSPELTFENLLEINPMLVKNLAYSQAVKDLCYSKLACINMYVKPTNRLCLFLYEMFSLYQKRKIHPNITQSELALLLNMHKVTLSNIIAQLKANNILEAFTKTEINILNPEELLRYGLSE